MKALYQAEVEQVSGGMRARYGGDVNYSDDFVQDSICNQKHETLGFAAECAYNTLVSGMLLVGAGLALNLTYQAIKTIELPNIELPKFEFIVIDENGGVCCPY
jgi:hypothetical protein